MGELVVTDEQVEAAARALCASRNNCFSGRVLDKPCIGDDGRNAPCQITNAQLHLSGLFEDARAAIAAYEAVKGT